MDATDYPTPSVVADLLVPNCPAFTNRINLPHRMWAGCSVKYSSMCPSVVDVPGCSLCYSGHIPSFLSFVPDLTTSTPSYGLAVSQHAAAARRFSRVHQDHSCRLQFSIFCWKPWETTIFSCSSSATATSLEPSLSAIRLVARCLTFLRIPYEPTMECYIVAVAPIRSLFEALLARYKAASICTGQYEWLCTGHSCSVSG